MNLLQSILIGIAAGVLTTVISIPISRRIKKRLEERDKSIVKIDPELEALDQINVDTGRQKPIEVSEQGTRVLKGNRVKLATYYFLGVTCEGGSKIQTTLPIISVKDGNDFTVFGATFWNAHDLEYTTIDDESEKTYFCAFMVDWDDCAFRMWNTSLTEWEKRTDEILDLKIKPEALNAKCRNLFLTVEINCKNGKGEVLVKSTIS